VRFWLGIVGLACATAASAADGAPTLRILKGELVEWNVRGHSGDLILEDDDGPRRWRCEVTPDTFLSRASIRIHPVGVRAGDRLEVVAETPGGAAVAASSCRARTVYVHAPDPRRVRMRQPWLTVSSYLDNLWPRGLLTFTGTVSRVEGNRLYLQTRKFGSKSFALRDDTVYSGAGRSLEATALANQTRVFIRASRTFDGDIEVYHVVWGNILQSRPGAW